MRVAIVGILIAAHANNWKHSSRIADKAVLTQVKVGDRIDITWTEAVWISADPPKSQ